MTRKLLSLLLLLVASQSFAQSISREWNNLILEAIRNDFARPTVHARNLYHHSIIAYDAWAAFDPAMKTFFLGDTLHGFYCPFDGISVPADREEARRKAISYASYRFIIHRYQNSPDYPETFQLINNLMNQYGYDVNDTSTVYQNGPAELGNYLAKRIIEYGYTDGSNEQNGYANQYYLTANPPIEVEQPGNPLIQDPNRWQAISLTQSIDQSGNIVQSTPPHLSPEWGNVHPFSLVDTMRTVKVRDGDIYNIYLDPGDPALLDLNDTASWTSFYKWNHSLVSIWQSHLDPNDGVVWDISPNSIGNVGWYPDSINQYPLFYDLLNGGDVSTGYTINPSTGLPYTPQMVPRGDYARVLAEFWADGIDSETPPGHWFEIYHYVLDQPGFERRWKGVGPILDSLEYDVKAHLALGGAMHDAAICAWGIKGYYDYIRPVSAIRYMADQGQSSDTTLTNYNPNGIPLLPGYIEVVEMGDPLAGTWNEHVGKIKVFTWRGHDYITDPTVEMAGVGWILAENWWPYQRPTFVTPPFAGYVSGHSTYSRAAAELMSIMTGSEYFPNGMGEFVATTNEYLHFEEGPSVDVHLQWAKYKDASDQCSLSRLWGGIHPPVDDIAGRKIGMIVGPRAFDKADSIYQHHSAKMDLTLVSDPVITLADCNGVLTFNFLANEPMDTVHIPNVSFNDPVVNTMMMNTVYTWVDSFQLQVSFVIGTDVMDFVEPIIILENVVTGSGDTIFHSSFSDRLVIDTKLPEPTLLTFTSSVLSDTLIGQIDIDIHYSEVMDTMQTPSLTFSPPSVNLATLLNETYFWLNDSIIRFTYDFVDLNEELGLLSVEIGGGADRSGNATQLLMVNDTVYLDTKNPLVVNSIVSSSLLNQNDLSNPTVYIDLSFSESMDMSIEPILQLQSDDINLSGIGIDLMNSNWINSNTYRVECFVSDFNIDYTSVDLYLSSCFDIYGNILMDTILQDQFFVDMSGPHIEQIIYSTDSIGYNDVYVGQYYIDIEFDEPMDITVKPLVQHQAAVSTSNSIQYDLGASYFMNDSVYRAVYNVFDENIVIEPIQLEISFAKDISSNWMISYIANEQISLDTENPQITSLVANTYNITTQGENIEVYVFYSEPMNNVILPQFTFSVPEIITNVLSPIDGYWVNESLYFQQYEVLGGLPSPTQVDLTVSAAVDQYNNPQLNFTKPIFLTIELLGTENLVNQNFVVYPNPVGKGETIFIESELVQGIGLNEVEIFDFMGRRIQIDLEVFEGQIRINIPSEIANGIYLLVIDELNITQRIVVKE